MLVATTILIVSMHVAIVISTGSAAISKAVSIFFTRGINVRMIGSHDIGMCFSDPYA